MKKILLLAVSVCPLLVAAQENNFLLYSFKGNVTVVENKSESAAKVGRVMNSGAVLKVPAGGVATLICNENAMFTVKKAGSFSMGQFGDSCKVKTGSVTSNYVKYVWNQMTKSSGSPGSNRKAFMNNVGAVTRSVNNIWIDPRLDTVNYVSGDFPLSWKSYAEAENFEFFLFRSNDGSPAFFRTTLDKLKIPISKFAAQLKPGNTYYWTAAVKGEVNEEVKTLNYVTREQFNQLLRELRSSLGAFETEAEEAYRLAFLLEDLHYLAQAYEYYSKASRLAPTNPLYRSTLMSFRKDYEIK
ncbi:MAG TPA: hypothetical protein VEB63_00485 [Chitinophagaceae bacterium]|nr:hypothetical protein [Chitinophagaceae bacterium]